MITMYSQRVWQKKNPRWENLEQHETKLNLIDNVQFHQFFIATEKRDFFYYFFPFETHSFMYVTQKIVCSIIK